MKVSLNAEETTLVLSGSSMLYNVFHATAKLHKVTPEPYSDESGEGLCYTIGTVMYDLSAGVVTLVDMSDFSTASIIKAAMAGGKS